MELVHDGDAVWGQQANNQPTSVYVEEGDSTQKKLNEATQEPNLFFFEHIHLPKLIQKETEKPGPGQLWTFGESTVR